MDGVTKYLLAVNLSFYHQSTGCNSIGRVPQQCGSWRFDSSHPDLTRRVNTPGYFYIRIYKMSVYLEEYINLIKFGKIGIIPTDTLYGIVANALNKDAVEKIYKIKKRQTSKPFIILISSIKDLDLFDVIVTHEQKESLAKLWPGPVSVILEANSNRFDYLHRGSNSLAFRLSNNAELQEFISKTGPLVAPSANPEGLVPAHTIVEAQHYFAQEVDFYIDGGLLNNKPSTIVVLSKTGSIGKIRE